MRSLKRILLVTGGAIFAALVYRVGAGPVLDALGRLRWWQLVLVCLPYGIIMAVDTLGWRFAFARDRASFRRLLGARLAGEALNLVTAVGSVGGEAAKAWLLRGDVSYEESVPALIIAKTTITMAQALLLLIGIVTAWVVIPMDSAVLAGMLWLLGIEVLAVGGFFVSQVSGLAGRAGGLLARVGLVKDAACAGQLDRALRTFYRAERRRFALSIGCHLVGWLLGVLEVLVMLVVLGVSVAPAIATVIEALGSGVRFAAFLVPASLGVTEGANAGAFAAVGLTAAAGVAFSLVRRARQIVWVLVGFLVLAAMRRSESRRAACRR